MTKNDQMEEFSRAFVGAIIARAGCSSSRYSIDDDSIDLTIKMIGIQNCKYTRAQIGIQLKCTKNVHEKNGSFQFPLSIKNYDDLRASTVFPRIAVIVHVPENINDWICQTKEHLCLYHKAHWINLGGYPPTENSKSVTISVSSNNLFTSDFIIDAMYKIANEQFP